VITELTGRERLGTANVSWRPIQIHLTEIFGAMPSCQVSCMKIRDIFVKGTGSFKSRAAYAAAAAVWCHRDNGTTGPNYANVLGNLIGGAISNLYYPEADRGVGLTFGRALTVTNQGAIGAELIEFWPDISRHYQRKHAEKMARKAAQKTADSNPQP